MTKPVYPIVLLLRQLHLNTNNRIEIWTARSDKYASATLDWLAKYRVPYYRLRMRRAGDHRDSREVKGEWLDECEEKGYRPDLILEDRVKLVEYFRGRGYVVLQPQSNDY